MPTEPRHEGERRGVVVPVEALWPERLRLEDAVHRIYRASVLDMYLPKNLAKGDDWGALGWLELEDLILDELRESREKAMDGDQKGALEEMGGLLVFCGGQILKGEGR